MNSRLSLFAFASLFLAATPLVRAQAPVQDAGRMQEMRQRLGLSDAQVDQLNAIFEEDGPKMKGLREDASLSDAQKREQLKALSDARREKIAAILTPEQRAKAAEEIKRRGGGPDGPQADGLRRLQAMKEKLGLSDTQVEKLKPILAEESPKMRAIREDSSASPEAKKEAVKQSMERIAAELTPEQLEKFKAEAQARKK
jgi:Spy/CpxP family protein refolding chaperone